MHGSVGKRVGGMGRNQALLLEDLEVCPEGEAAKDEDRFWVEGAEFGFEIGAAVCEFRSKRLVCGRGATNGDSDVCVEENQAVATAFRCGLVGKTGAMECVKQEVARAVAGEGASRAIAAVSRGSQADDEELRMRIAKSGNGLAPVVAFEESAAFGASDGLAITHQTRALPAGNDFLVQDFQFVCWVQAQARPSRKHSRQIDTAATRRLAYLQRFSLLLRDTANRCIQRVFAD